jgi:hypothetical protein
LSQRAHSAPAAAITETLWEAFSDFLLATISFARRYRDGMDMGVMKALKL